MRNQIKSLTGILAEGNLDFELYFMTEVLGLRSLHYGYWDDPPEHVRLDLPVFETAQARYTERLLEHVPDGVEHILDVGAGIGDTSRELAERGYTVHAISPDRNHRRYFTTLQHPNVTFETARYEDFTSWREFDLVLFSESHNYIKHEIGLEQSRRFLKPGGHILIAGMFRYYDRQPFPPDFPLSDLPYLETAAEYGFVPDLLVDITENVRPTLEMVYDTYTRHIEPFLELTGSYFRKIAPVKSWLVSQAARPQLEKLQEILDYYVQRMNPDYFEKHNRYAFVRLRDDEAV